MNYFNVWNVIILLKSNILMTVLIAAYIQLFDFFFAMKYDREMIVVFTCIDVVICFTGLQSIMTRDHSFPQNAEFWAEPRNLPISAEFLCFHEILRNSVLAGDKGTNMAYFDGVQAAVLYVFMTSPWNTRLPFGLWQEEYWKYSAELIWNIAG